MGNDAGSNKRTVDPLVKEVRLTALERFCLAVVRRAIEDSGFDPK